MPAVGVAVQQPAKPDGDAGEKQQKQPPKGETQAPKGEGKSKPVTDAIKARCAGTLGTWCADFWTQAEVPAVTAPRGNKECSLDCNKVRGPLLQLIWEGVEGLPSRRNGACWRACD